jgi:hypothetical protein
MKFKFWQEDPMGAKSKSAAVRRAPCKRAAKPPAVRRRRRVTARGALQQTAPVTDQRGGGIDGQRLVQGEGGRTLPLRYDEYN